MSSSDEEPPLRIPLKDIITATDNFSLENLLNQGETVDVYKGSLFLQSKLVDVVIRKYKSSTDHTFKLDEEIKRLSPVKHKHVVSVIGFCDEDNKRMIVMEHAVKGSLDEYLSDPTTLTWSQRLYICFCAAWGLKFWQLKDYRSFSTKHFKVLLGKEWEAKLLISTDSLAHKRSSYEYSLGVILLEMLYRRKATIEDVNQYINSYDYDERDFSIIPGIAYTSLNRESLSILSLVAYECLKNGTPEEIFKRLHISFKIQWKHENPSRVAKLADLKIPLSRIKLATDNFQQKDFSRQPIYINVYKEEINYTDSESLLTIGGEQLKRRVIIIRFNKFYKTPEDFFAEIEMLSSYKHSNVASLHGFCDEDSEMVLVFECRFKETLDDYLQSTSKTFNLTWEQRIRICLNIARGLKYLHGMQGQSSMIHHGILSANVFLDETWTAKIADFRLAELSSYGQSGRYIYFLGLVLFEILTGRLVDHSSRHKVEKFATWARQHFNEGNLKNITDHRIIETHECSYNPNEKGLDEDSFNAFSEIANQCLIETPNERPTLEVVIKSLNHALDLQIKKFPVKDCPKLIPLDQIISATKNFDRSYCIGSQDDHEVYEAKLESVSTIEGKNKGERPKKTVIVKRLINHKDKDGNMRGRFFIEVNMLSSCKHPNLLSLHGFCYENSEMILVFEGAFKQTLDNYLRSTSKTNYLTWEQRVRICLNIAHGLKHLHNMEEGKKSLSVTYQGIRSANVLLDETWNARIASFRVSKTDSQTNTINTPGTHGCMDSEHFMIGNLISSYSKLEIYPEREKATRWIKESDLIYSLGVILFEMLTGRLADDPYMAENANGLVSMVQKHFSEGTLNDMADRRIMEEAQECSYKKNGPDQDSFNAFCEIAYKCLVENERERITWEDAIKSLENALQFQVKNFKYMTIPLNDIKSATNTFDKACFLGSGGYGAVYKAELKTNSRNELGETLNTVAIKRIHSREDDKGKEGFFTELDVLTRCEHPNIVNLVGFCVEESEWILVYEYASNGSLNAYLGSTDNKIYLTWAQCLKICIDIAKGLRYLHTNMENKRMILHGDIKSDNILLGKNLEAKIADFGLSKFRPANQQASTINTNTLVGTEVYCDPEYRRTGKLKKASDIYSLGVVLFEIFSGKLAYDSNFMKENEKGLAAIARIHFEKGTLKELLDPRLTKNAYELGFSRKVGPDHESLDAFSRIAYKCLAKTQGERPRIDVVIEELEKALYIQEKAMKSTLKISLEHIKPSVKNFSDDNCFMKGGYGRLYKGQVQYNNGDKKVLVKRFSTSSQKDGFLKDFEILYKYQHENIIRLVGYCKENFEKIILYEHASLGSLNRYLNDTSFSWPQRLKICIDIAKGLNFLHGGYGGQDVVIHRDMKSSNILLTGDWKAKICGFELAVTYPANKKIEYVKNDVVGSPGYCDPLYRVTLVLTKESDIYSLGVILFEMLCGRSACPDDLKDCSQFLDVLVKQHFQEARIEEIVFEGIREHIAPKSLITFRRIAIQCLHDEIKERPMAGDVAEHLKKALEFQEAYEKRESDSTMAKKNIYNILSSGLLHEDDRLEIMRFLQETTRNPEQSVHFIGENDG